MPLFVSALLHACEVDGALGLEMRRAAGVAREAAEAQSSPGEALRKSLESRRKTSVDQKGHMQGIREASSRQEETGGGSSSHHTNSGGQTHMEAAAAAATAKEDRRDSSGGGQYGGNWRVLDLLGGGRGRGAESAAGGQGKDAGSKEGKQRKEGETAERMNGAAEAADSGQAQQGSEDRSEAAAVQSVGDSKGDEPGGSSRERGAEPGESEATAETNPYSSHEGGEEDDEEGRPSVGQRLKDSLHSLGLGHRRSQDEGGGLLPPDKDTTAVSIPKQDLGKPSSALSGEGSKDMGPIWNSRESMQSAMQVSSLVQLPSFFACWHCCCNSASQCLTLCARRCPDSMHGEARIMQGFPGCFPDACPAAQGGADEEGSGKLSEGGGGGGGVMADALGAVQSFLGSWVGGSMPAVQEDQGPGVDDPNMAVMDVPGPRPQPQGGHQRGGSAEGAAGKGEEGGQHAVRTVDLSQVDASTLADFEVRGLDVSVLDLHPADHFVSGGRAAALFGSW